MRDLRPMNAKRCYACLNWDGVRTVYHSEKKIKADDNEKANCRFYHQPRFGHDSCEQFNPIQ